MSWTPQESALDLYNERTALAGTIVSAFVYGIHFTLYAMCTHLLVKQTPKKTRTWVMLIYTTVMFILGTLYMGSEMKDAQLAFIDDRNFPGGPAAFEVAEFDIPVNQLSNDVAVIANWLADGLMLWRCTVIWQGPRAYLIMFFPSLIFLCSIVMSILLLVQVAQPTLSLWTKTSVDFALPWFSLSLSLNIIVTIAIIVRLLSYRRRARAVLGHEHGSQYTSIVAMIIESAAITSITSLLFLIPFALNNPIQTAFLQVYSPAQMISPLLIIFRVARGRAWSSDITTTIAGPSNIHFKDPKYYSSDDSAMTETGNYPTVIHDVTSTIDNTSKDESTK